MDFTTREVKFRDQNGSMVSALVLGGGNVDDAVAEWCEENIDQTAVEEMVAADVAELKNEFIPYLGIYLPLEQGYWGIANGVKTNSANWCRTATFIPNGYIIRTTTSVMLLQAFNVDGTYVGTWNGTSFGTAVVNTGRYKEINTGKWMADYPTYKFTITFWRSNAAFTPSDVYNELVLEFISNTINTQNDIYNTFTWNDNKLLDWYGVLSSETNYFTTDAVDISEYAGTILNFCGYKYSGDRSGICFYDADNVFIKGVNPTTQGNLPSGETYYDVAIQVPMNAKYCKICVLGVKIYTRIYVSLKELAKQVVKIEELKNSDFGGTLGEGSNSLANTYPIVPAGWETHAETSFEAVAAKMKELGYDGVPVFIETDSHGNSLAPFAWVDSKDKSIKNIHLGDFVKDTYNLQDINNVYDFASRVDNIACVVGNHDVTYGTEAMSNYILTRYLPTTDRHLGSNLNYYFVDDHDYQIRYITLNPHTVSAGGTSSTHSFDEKQIKWLIDTLLSSPYDVVILNHVPICSSMTDRAGNSVTFSGPYPTNLGTVKTILETYQSKGSTTVTIDSTISVDFTSVSNNLLCALHGHTHSEGTAFSNGIRYYVADNFQYSDWANTFCVIDRANSNLLVYRFDITQNNTLWTLPLYSAT